MSENRKNTRRSFLKMGLGAAAIAPVTALGLSNSAFAATDPKAIKWDDEMDVLVIGSGMAGMIAGIRAAETDPSIKVVVADKMSRLGGSSLISGLNMAVVGSDLQEKIGVTDDSWELLLKDIEKEAKGYNHRPLTEVAAKGTLKLYNFLKDHGVQYDMSIGGGTGVKKLGGHSRARCVWPAGGGTEVIKKLQQFCAEKLTNLEIRKKVLLEEILRNDEGRVIGVRVREKYRFNSRPEDLGDNDNPEINKSGKTKYYKVKRGLVMGSGGYNQDRRFRGDEVGTMYNAASTTQPGATAGAIKAMINSGFKPIHMTLFRFAFPIPTEDILWGILVNPRTGERFVDEYSNNDRQTIGMAILEERRAIDGEHTVLIYDQKGADEYHDQQRLHLSLDGKNGTNGTIWKFETLEELAANFDMNITTLKANIEKYNADMENDQDAFHKPKSKLKTATSISKAPYYAMQLNPRYNYAQGGALITPEARAIDVVTGDIIPGAFVCGEAAAGTYGYIRLTACSTIDCGTFGMVAGENAAKEQPWS